MSKPAHAVINCRLPEIEANLDIMAEDWRLLACSTYPVGNGFGAFVNAVLIFERKPQVGRPPKLDNNGVDKRMATDGAR